MTDQERTYTRAEAQAMVAAALSEIRTMAREGCDAPNAAYRWCERIEEATHADALSALDRVKAEARREGMLEAAQIADNAKPEYDGHRDHDRAEREDAVFEALSDVAAAIRAEAEREKG